MTKGDYGQYIFKPEIWKEYVTVIEICFDKIIHPLFGGMGAFVCWNFLTYNEDWSSLFLTKNIQKKWRDSLFLTKHIIFSDFTVVMWCQLGLFLYRILQVLCDEYLISTKGQQLFQSLLILPVTRQAIKNAYFHSLSVV